MEISKEDLAELLRNAKLDKTNIQKVFDAIRSEEMDFDDFYYGWLDNFRNEEWGKASAFNEWKDAVIEQTMAAHIYTVEHECDPHKALNDVISWHCKVALDPKVSSDAAAIVEECAQICMSQADRKNIRKRFGLPVESNIKYSGPEPHNSITSQYTRQYNLPRGENERKD